MLSGRESRLESNQGLFNPGEDGLWPLQFVLPEAEHAPAGAAEGAGDEAVAGLITGQLVFPERMVVGRDIGVFRAGVPEAPSTKMARRAFRKMGDNGGVKLVRT